MDLDALFKRGISSFAAANMTGLAGNLTRRRLPEGMMENLMPLMGGQFNPLVRALMVVYDMMGSRLGLDPTVILTFFGFLWAANKLWRQLYMTAFRFVQDHLMAYVHVSNSDDIYLHMMKWLAAQPYLTTSRSLMAETVGKTAWEDEDESAVLTTRISADGSGVYLNFSNQEAKSVS